MAKHKAPTQVTLVPHEEKSAFAEFVDKYWKIGAALAVIATLSILYFQYQKERADAQVDESWNALMTVVEERRGLQVADLDALEKIAGDLQGTAAGPWSLYLQAETIRQENRVEDALGVLSRLKSEYPDHPLVREKHLFGESVTPLSLVDHLSRTYSSELSWRAENPRFFGNPDLPGDAPRIRFQTERGDIVVGLYADRAPKHAENLLKLAGEGFFDGTKFHQVNSGLMIAGGDPATKESAVEDWPRGGQGADHSVEPEDSGLSLFGGYLGSVVKPNEETSNGSLFLLSVEPMHGLDSRSTVYGKILEGLDVVREISDSPTALSSPGAPQIPSDRPEEPVAILSTEVITGT